MQTCRLMGHRYAFVADGPVMRWSCDRGCGAGGSKTYATAAEATRYARGLSRRDSDDVGRRAPLLGMLPLRIWRALRRRPTRATDTPRTKRTDG